MRRRIADGLRRRWIALRALASEIARWYVLNGIPPGAEPEPEPTEQVVGTVPESAADRYPGRFRLWHLEATSHGATVYFNRSTREYEARIPCPAATSAATPSAPGRASGVSAAPATTPRRTTDDP